jgi:delta1-piperideine-2-carboxylate reductase
MRLDAAALQDLVARIFVRAGLSADNAAIVAGVVVAAERDGTTSHGLFRLPGYLATMRTGWVDGRAVPTVTQVAPTLLLADARNGFAQVALAAARDRLSAMARAQGMAALCTGNAHHFAALWPDVEPFAEAGLIALTVLNSRSRIVVFGGRRKVLGTNPIAFACPRGDGPPLVWDQATSVLAQGEVLRARQAGHAVPPGVGVDAAGRPTQDAAAILDGGALLPFGGHKGATIALMIEVLAAALSGGRLGFEDRSAEYPGAQTSNGGQFVLLIDPTRTAGAGFSARIETLVAALRDAGSERLPSDARHARRLAAKDGIEVADSVHAELLGMLGGSVGSGAA